MAQESGYETLPWYVHIQKNGGNTVRDYLVSALGDNFAQAMIPSRILRDGRARNWSNSAEDAAELIGEVSAGRASVVAVNLAPPADSLSGKTPAPFAYLREPTSRCISFWQHAYRLRDYGPAWSVIEDGKWDARRAVESGLLQLSNDQVRLITGESRRSLGQADLERAKEIIESSYLLVATVDRIADTLPGLVRNHGADPHVQPGHLNSRPNAEEDAPYLEMQLEMFHSLNELDIALFTWLEAQGGIVRQR